MNSGVQGSSVNIQARFRKDKDIYAIESMPTESMMYCADLTHLLQYWQHVGYGGPIP
jgi:hypothetical protein